MAPSMRRRFSSRDELIEYLRREFPKSAAVDDESIAFDALPHGGRSAAIQTLERIDPIRYASSRNALNGAVTHLSPYLRHGVVGLAEVRDTALDKVNVPHQAGKLLNELAWRDYFQRVYAVVGDAIWTDIEPYKTGRAAGEYADSLPDDIRAGTTGLACMDAFRRALCQKGYLHNHARMWLASYIVHWRQVRWQAGARWFLTHLLDGDPASNNLSWQWVASTFSHKPYIFNQQNLERYTNGVYCQHCPLRRQCPLEGEYEEINYRLGLSAHARSINAPADHLDGQKGQRSDNHIRDSLARVRAVVPRRERGEQLPENAAQPQTAGRKTPPIIWVHGDSMRPDSAAFRTYPAAPAIWVWDEDLLDRWQIGLKRILFLYECLLELPVSIRRGSVADEVLAFAQENRTETVVTTESPSPRFRDIRAQLDGQLACVVTAEVPFVSYNGVLDLRRFSRYWRRVGEYAFEQEESHGGK